MPPLKRHDDLKPLSRDHHHALLLCWRVRRDLAERADLDQVLLECHEFFKIHIAPHFTVEEEAVFPVLGNEHPLVQRALSEHRRLVRLFSETKDPLSVLSRIEDELDAHIRFEERTLFPEVQRLASPAHLHRIAEVHGAHGPVSKE
ncbi:MAG: hemerythrin domain-containing protein [Flavobacteriales bacterium]|nr:hemerythrin domain-containing protein [Flavobacteriales bacterium]